MPLLMHVRLLRDHWFGLSSIVVLIGFPLFNALCLVPFIGLGLLGGWLWIKSKPWKVGFFTPSLSIIGASMVALGIYSFTRSSLSHGINDTWAVFDRHLPLFFASFFALGLSTIKPRGNALQLISRLSAMTMIIAAVYYSIFKESLLGPSSFDMFSITIPMPFINKLLLAQIWMTTGFLSILGLTTRTAFWDKALVLLGYISALYGVSFLASSRGPMLILISQLPLLVVLLVLGKPKSLEKILKALGISIIMTLAIFGGGLAILFAFDADILDRLASAASMLISFGEDDSSLAERFAIYKAALSTIQQSPWVGHGIAERLNSVYAYLPHNFPSYSHLHNVVFNLLVDGGIVSLILFLIPTGIIWYLALSNRSKDNLFAAYFLTIPPLAIGLSNSILHTAETGSHYFLGLIMIAWCLGKTQSTAQKNKGSEP